MADNPISGHTAGTNDGLRDGDHILSPSLTNIYEGLHGNGILSAHDTAFGDSARNTPTSLGGAVSSGAAHQVTIKACTVILDGVPYPIDNGSGGDVTINLTDEGTSGSAFLAGTTAAPLTSGKECLFVILATPLGAKFVQSTIVTSGTGVYPDISGSIADKYLKMDGVSAASNKQSIVLATVRAVFNGSAASGNDLDLTLSQINDKRVFIRPSPIYLSPVTSEDVGDTDTINSHTALEQIHGDGEHGSFGNNGALWQSYGTQLADTVAGDNAKDVLYYSGKHAARFTRSVFDRVLTSADLTLTLTSTDANVLILTPGSGAGANIITNGTFPAGYMIHIRNLHATRYVRFALTSSSSSTMATFYSISGATFASFVCTTSHASYPTFALLFDDTIDTPQVADDAVTLAKMASGTDGNIISYDTNGNPVAVATGNDGQVLTSAGAGAVPTFETLPAIAAEEVTLAMLAHAAANTVLVRDADDAGDPSFKAVTNTQILIGDGTGFTAAALSGDVTMTNAGVVAIGDSKIDSQHYVDASIDNEHLANNAVDSDEIAADAVITAKVLDGNITMAKLASIATDTFVGRTADNAGVPKALSKTEALAILNVADGANAYVHPNHSGDVTSSADGATTIAANAVTLAKMAGIARGKIIVGDASGDPSVLAAGANGKLLVADANGDPSWTTVSGDVTTNAGAVTIAADAVTYAKMQNVTATSRVLGRITSSAGVVEELTQANLRTIIAVADGSLSQNNFTTTLKNKLDAIEASATIDQTASEILTLIEDGVDSVHYKNASIDNEHLADNAVNTDEIAASAVTLAKMANLADGKVLGNISGSAAAPAALSAANLRTLLGVADGSLSQNSFTNADHTKLNAITAEAVSAAEAILAVQNEGTLDLTGLVTITDSGNSDGTDGLLRLTSAGDSARLIVEAPTSTKVPILHFRDTAGNANLNDSAILALDRNADIWHYEDGVGSAQNDFIISNGISDKDIHFATNTGSTNTAATIKATLKHDGGFQFRASVEVCTSDPAPAISETGTIYQFTKGSAGTFTLPASPPVGTQFVLVNGDGQDIVITRPHASIKINGATANKTNTTAYAATSIVATVSNGNSSEWLVFGGI